MIKPHTRESPTSLLCLLKTSSDFNTAAIFRTNTVALFHWLGYVISFLSCEAAVALSQAHYDRW